MINLYGPVLHTLETRLFVATAQEVAEELDISTSTARRWLNQAVSDGRVEVHRTTGFADSGRETNVNSYSMKKA